MKCELCHAPIEETDDHNRVEKVLLCDIGPVHHRCAIQAVNREVAARTRTPQGQDANVLDAITDLRKRVAQLEDRVAARTGG